MATKSVNILSEAYQLVLLPDRKQRLWAANRLAGVISDNLKAYAPQAITGEAGAPNWTAATRHLVERRNIHPIEAQMAAGVVATGAIAAHEIVTLTPVSEDQARDLTRHLTDGALRLTGRIYQVNE